MEWNHFILLDCGDKSFLSKPQKTEETAIKIIASFPAKVKCTLTLMTALFYIFISLRFFFLSIWNIFCAFILNRRFFSSYWPFFNWLLLIHWIFCFEILDFRFLNFGGLTFVLSLVFHVLALCPKKAVEATLTCNCN